ncbi:MAG TPA: MFS transporter [Eubacteriaceae bacterium]|nr:MFS transporter [Eubacteriaceae bacterium]
MKLNYKRTFFIGLAFMSISAFWQLYDNLIPLMLKNTFGLGETITGIVMALDNVLALFLLPIFGAFSDRVNTRLGKRTPFIIVGTLLTMTFMVIIPIADQMNHFALFFVSLGATLISTGIYRSPAVALMPDLTPKPLRSKGNAVINLMGAVGGIIALLVISLLVPDEMHPDYTWVFVTVAALMGISLVVLLTTIKEKKLANEIDLDPLKQEEEEKSDNIGADGKLSPEVKRSLSFLLLSVFLWFTAYNAVTTAFSRYATTVWGLTGGKFANALMVAMGAAIISFIPVGILSSKVGRKKMILSGVVLMSLSYFAGIFFLEYSPWINLVFVFTGIGWASINVNSYPMVVEMSKKADVGKYTGYYYTFSMAAQIFTPIFSGFLLESISYRILFPYAVAFSVLSFCTMLFVKHGDSRPTDRKPVLEHFDVED